jgi:hypothetical protein
MNMRSNTRSHRGGAVAWLPWITFGVLACQPARAAGLLDEYVQLQSGDFTSQAQASQDPGYQVAVWHIVEIWRGADSSERWLYTEAWLDKAPVPYIQRVTRVTAEGDGTIVASRHTVPDAARFVGAWGEPGRFAALKPSELSALPGCEVMIVRAGAGRFEGSTVGARCRITYKGAAYAVSNLTLTADGMTNWDRGFDADGALKWGPAKGGYRFVRRSQ